MLHNNEETLCDGQHRYFALEMIVEADQSIKIPLVCTQCGDLKVHELPSKVHKS